MNITRHAKKRLKERVNVKKSSTDKNTKLALEFGMRHSDASGRLKKYFDWLFLTHNGPHNNNTNTRIYNDFVYIFTKDENLITVLSLPNEHINAYRKFKNKQKSVNHGEEPELVEASLQLINKAKYLK